MITTKIRTLELDYDTIEIHYNKYLKRNPYLIRVFSYNNSEPDEYRATEDDVKNLYFFLKNNKIL